MLIPEKLHGQLLTAIIPVSDPTNRIEFINSWVKLLRANLPIDFVFVLDSSLENDKKVFEEFTSTLIGNNFTILEANEGSPGGSRNVALERVNTKWVCFWDSDDFPYPENILTAINNLQNPVDVIIGNYATLEHGHKVRKIASSSDLDLFDIFSRSPGIWRMIFLSELIKNERFLNFRMAEDQLFLAKLGLAERQYTFNENTFYGYIQHEALRLTKSIEALNDLLKVQEELSKLIPSQFGENRLISTLVFLRLTVSGVSRLNWAKKYALLKNLVSFESNPKNLINTVRVILKVMKRW